MASRRAPSRSASSGRGVIPPQYPAAPPFDPCDYGAPDLPMGDEIRDAARAYSDEHYEALDDRTPGFLGWATGYAWHKDPDSRIVDPWTGGPAHPSVVEAKKRRVRGRLDEPDPAPGLDPGAVVNPFGDVP